eukprot:165954-Prymnesium_polylepis.1
MTGNAGWGEAAPPSRGSADCGRDDIFAIGEGGGDAERTVPSNVSGGDGERPTGRTAKEMKP